jgi:hypothetical protein
MCNFPTRIRSNEDSLFRKCVLKHRVIWQLECRRFGGTHCFSYTLKAKAIKPSKTVGYAQTTRPHNPVNNVCNSGPDIFRKADNRNV